MIRLVNGRCFSMSLYRRNLRGAPDQPLFDGVLRVTGSVGQRAAVVEVFGGPNNANVDLYVGDRLMGSGHLDELGQGTIILSSWPDRLLEDVELRCADQLVASAGPLVRAQEPPDEGRQSGVRS